MGGSFDFAKNPSAHGVFGSFTWYTAHRTGPSLFSTTQCNDTMAAIPTFPNFFFSRSSATISSYIHPHHPTYNLHILKHTYTRKAAGPSADSLPSLRSSTLLACSPPAASGSASNVWLSDRPPRRRHHIPRFRCCYSHCLRTGFSAHAAGALRMIPLERFIVSVIQFLFFCFCVPGSLRCERSSDQAAGR